VQQGALLFNRTSMSSFNQQSLRTL